MGKIGACWRQLMGLNHSRRLLMEVNGILSKPAFVCSVSQLYQLNSLFELWWPSQSALWWRWWWCCWNMVGYVGKQNTFEFNIFMEMMVQAKAACLLSQLIWQSKEKLNHGASVHRRQSAAMAAENEDCHPVMMSPFWNVGIPRAYSQGLFRASPWVQRAHYDLLRWIGHVMVIIQCISTLNAV